MNNDIRRAGSRFLALALVLVLGSCAEEIETAPPPSPGTVQALFDPSSTPPAIPIPTDLARDPATGLLKVPVADEKLRPAQAYLDRYLNTLDGYPTSVTAEARFTGEVDPRTISSKTIVVIDISSVMKPAVLPASDLIIEHGTTETAEGAVTSLVRIWSRSGWRRAASYAVFIKGGREGVKSKDGTSIIPSALFALATASRPLCAWDPVGTWDSASGSCRVPPAEPPPGQAASEVPLGCCTDNYSSLIAASVKEKVRSDPASQGQPLEAVEALAKAKVLETATTFERMRRSYTALLALGDAMGVKSDEVALLWSFSTVGINEAIFDPASSPPDVPTPTDLIRDPKSGQLRIPIDPSASPAEKEFNTYLNGLDGYPTGSVARVSFTGELDQAATEGGVLVYEVDATDPSPPKLTKADGVAVSYDAAKRAISVSAKAGFKRATSYVLATVGGTSGLKNTDRGLAESPVRSATMHLALCPVPLCSYDAGKGTCLDALVSSFIDDPKEKPGALTGVQKATTLEQIRRRFDPLARELATAASIDREQISALWTFTVTSQAEVIYDPSTSEIPFPNNLLRDPATGKVSIPATPGESAGDKALRQGLNTLDGFTTLGTYFAPYGGTIDKASLAGSVLALNTDAGVPVMSFDFEVDESARVLKAIPNRPLEEKTTYAIVILSRHMAGDLQCQGGLRDDKGRYVIPSSFMALMRSRHPVYDAAAGRSLISTVDDATAELVERARVAHKPLFDALTALSIEREDIAAAWTFTTQSITEPLTKLRALPWKILAALDGNAPKLQGTLDTSTSGFPTKAPPSNLGGWIAKGTFQSWMALDEHGTGALLPDPTKGKPVDLEFTLTVPKGPMPAAGWPLVVFQHGIGRSRQQALLLADRIAQSKHAMIAFDAVYHGSRSWCTQDAECTGTCDKATGKCSGNLVDSDGDGTPDASGGEKFLNTGNPFAIRDNVRQHVVDAAALLRAISLGGAAALKGPKVKLDLGKVYHWGISLGGILGTLVLATDSLPQRGVFSVVGAPVVDIYMSPNGSITYKSIREQVLKAYNIADGSREFLQLVTTFKWILDPADPANFARYVTTDQLDDLVLGAKVPNKQVIVQLAGKDPTIPVHFGQYLADVMGADTTDTLYPTQGHSMLTKADPDPGATQAARTQAVTFLSTGTVCKPDTTSGACD